ncbi:Rsp [Neisseria gonorrhoeae]|uniref:Rsp n=1 Tax=Neisseria gonorrhoeae TaxID=485 RepID=A0A378VUT5_NEIGO|nr:Rsp [Neisseria gonorrhoeae]
MPSLREMRENLKLPTPTSCTTQPQQPALHTLPAAQQMLLNYSYPGNFRELETSSNAPSPCASDIQCKSTTCKSKMCTTNPSGRKPPSRCRYLAV